MPDSERLQIWDIPGSTRWSGVAAHLRKCAAAVICVSVPTMRDSHTWRDTLGDLSARALAAMPQGALLLVVGTLADCLDPADVKPVSRTLASFASGAGSSGVELVDCRCDSSAMRRLRGALFQSVRSARILPRRTGAALLPGSPSLAASPGRNYGPGQRHGVEGLATRSAVASERLRAAFVSVRDALEAAEERAAAAEGRAEAAEAALLRLGRALEALASGNPDSEVLAALDRAGVAASGHDGAFVASAGGLSDGRIDCDGDGGRWVLTPPRAARPVERAPPGDTDQSAAHATPTPSSPSVQTTPSSSPPPAGGSLDDAAAVTPARPPTGNGGWPPDGTSGGSRGRADAAVSDRSKEWGHDDASAVTSSGADADTGRIALAPPGPTPDGVDSALRSATPPWVPGLSGPPGAASPAPSGSPSSADDVTSPSGVISLGDDFVADAHGEDFMMPPVTGGGP